MHQTNTRPIRARRRPLAVALIGVVAALVVPMLTSCEPTTPAPTDGQVTAAGFKYSFQNWDWDGTKHDMPVSMIFISNSTDMVSRVYSQMGSVGLVLPGDQMALSGVGGSRQGVSETDPWTSHSAGRKGAFGCWGQCDAKTDIHVRTYGPDGSKGTQVYQGTYGLKPYYLIATTHFDSNEGTSTADFGYSDTARKLLVDQLVAAKKRKVVTSVDVKNACNGRTDSTHFCLHDGKALVIDIDG